MDYTFLWRDEIKIYEIEKSHGAHLINIWNLLSSRKHHEEEEAKEEEEGNLIISQHNFFMTSTKRLYIYEYKLEHPTPKSSTGFSCYLPTFL